MRTNEQRRGALYKAFSGPIMDLRIRLSQADVGGAPLNAKQVDAELSRLEIRIWREVKNALGIEEARGPYDTGYSADIVEQAKKGGQR